MQDQSALTTLLFTHIEASARLGEKQPKRMPSGLAAHDAIARTAVEANLARPRHIDQVVQAKLPQDFPALLALEAT